MKKIHLAQRIPGINASSLTLYCCQIFIVLSGSTLGLWFLRHWFVGIESWIVPVTLGAIATALTDFDDRLSIRLRNLGLVCILFFMVSSILTFLHPYTLLFILYLSLSSAAFVLLGALGQRYAAISFGTLLLSIYTLFGINDYAHWSMQPSLFVLGALWYGLTSLLFYLLKPTQAVQDHLAHSFAHLAAMLQSKSELFDPDHSIHAPRSDHTARSSQTEQLIYQVSQHNVQVVNHLNQSKRALLTRLKASRANQRTIRWLNLYFLAQDMHEQASANYLHYEHIHQNFHRSDLVFRIQKNLRLQGLACQQLAHCILHQKPFQLPHSHQQAMQQLQLAMQEWIALHPENVEVKNLGLVFQNLNTTHEQLQQFELQQYFLRESQEILPPAVAQGTSTTVSDDLNLMDDDIQGWTDLWLKLKPHLSPQSALFRHAVRIAVVFAVGCLLSLLPFAQHGYWILLTSLFVCQISYFATKSRLKLRTLGTILGVLLGIPVLYFVPSIEGQLLLTIVFGVSFFYLRAQKYAMATLMATLVVLLIFNMKGAGYSVILPRIIDTLLGCALAWLAVSLIWPDWNFRNIAKNVDLSLRSALSYFDQVLAHYQQGKNNSVAYRKARRDAHNAQTELSAMISSLSTEPHPNTALVQTAFRYLVYSHSQLSYIAALGSHRGQINDPQILALMQWCSTALNATLLQQQPLASAELNAKLTLIRHLSLRNELNDQQLLVLKQLSLMLETLPELLSLKQQLLALDA